MKIENKDNEKSMLHSRNKHKERYDLKLLGKNSPGLIPYIKLNPIGEPTIDFSDNKAVLFLNKALLAKYYNVKNWQIPEGYLCPPIPGRADYIHYTADLLSEANEGTLPKGKRIKVLDIGTGANCIYPIIGSQEYGWKMTGSDIDPISVKTARLIVQSNPTLAKKIIIKEQKNRDNIFEGIIEKNERYDITISNPPYHASEDAANKANLRKLKNLAKGKMTEQKARFNFGGSPSELWCKGGEYKFIKKIADESSDFSAQVLWFSTVVSKRENIESLEKHLKRVGACEIKIMKMAQGQKTSHILAWSYFSAVDQKRWAKDLW